MTHTDVAFNLFINTGMVKYPVHEAHENLLSLSSLIYKERRFWNNFTLQICCLESVLDTLF